jgi:hypothetical protein
MIQIMQLNLNSLNIAFEKKILVVDVVLLIFSPSWLGMLILSVVRGPPELPYVDVTDAATRDPNFDASVSS